MQMRFIAYDPKTREKIMLKKHSFCKDEGRCFCCLYYSDEAGNVVYNYETKMRFERNHYRTGLLVWIADRTYYLIGDY